MKRRRQEKSMAENAVKGSKEEMWMLFRDYFASSSINVSEWIGLHYFEGFKNVAWKGHKKR